MRMGCRSMTLSWRSTTTNLGGATRPTSTPRKSALPLRMVEVENPYELLYETFSAFQRLGPPLSLAGPAPLAILTLPPLRSDNSNDGGPQLVETWEAAD